MTESSKGLEALERALEGLFRIGGNRRFDARQAAAVGAVVTRAGYAALRCLSDRGTLTLREVAEACAMDGATASRQLAGLVDEGLVERRTAPSDGRSIELTLTPRGREVYERIVRYRLAHLASAVSDWSGEDRDRLAELVHRLTDGLARTPPPRSTDGPPREHA